MKILKRLRLIFLFLLLAAVIVFGGIGLAKFVLLVQKWEHTTSEQNVLVADSADFRKYLETTVKGRKTMSTVREKFDSPLASQLELGEKFGLLVDLGEITVPADYVHSVRLTAFSKENRLKFSRYGGNITDKYFANPTRILKSGDKLGVRAFKQVVPSTTTSEERMAFLATQKAIHTGAQGASLVFDQKRDQLPKGKWYASFDEREHLHHIVGGYSGVPRLGCTLRGHFEFELSHFEGLWYKSDAILCFNDLDE